MLSNHVTVGTKAALLGAFFVGIASHSAFAADANTYPSVTVTAPDEPPAITLNLFRIDHWSIPKNNALVYRTDNLEGTSNWGQPVATLPWGTDIFVDTNVEVGKRYLYRVVTDGANGSKVTRYTTGGIATPLVENRGIMLLITDNVTAPQLEPEIARFKMDLIGDGYRVQQISVSPNDTPQSVKAKIVAAHQANPGQVKSVTLLGNIPVAYSGWVNPDGHGSWPFPTDSYYGDIDGNWTDSTRNSNNTAGHFSWWVNTPGDGKFDQNTTPSPVDLQVGRISFNNMPAFSESEVELMRRYLDKNHAYRHNQFTFNATIMTPQEDSLTGYGASGPLFGTDNRPFVPSIDAERSTSWWNEAENNSYWLSTWHRGGGYYDSTWGIGNARGFANSPGVNTAIQSAWASYYGEWDVQNAFLRAMLAARGQTVATFYENNPDWALYGLGAGDTIGNAWKTTVNLNGVALGSTSYARSIIPALLGDPSIRLFPITPASNLTATPAGNGVTLTWEPSPDEGILGYYLYRAESLDGEFFRISPALIQGLSFTDLSPLAEAVYMLRAVKLQETGSGTYYDASQGIFAFAMVPEPATALIIGTSGILLVRRPRSAGTSPRVPSATHTTA